MFACVALSSIGKLCSEFYSALEISCEKIINCLPLLHVNYEIQSYLSFMEVKTWICRFRLYSV
jgi:hypothetical protein